MAAPISVISSDYCLPYSIKLTIDAKKGVTSSNDGVIFRVEEPSFTLHSRRVLHDVSGKPVLTLHKKRTTVHGRWQVFKHASAKSDDLLFSVKRSSFRKPRNKNINLEVFLAQNTEERVYDFKVNACASKKSCDICAQGSSTILAKMTNKVEVEVQPNVDYAFIVALLMIVHEINRSGIDTSEVIEDAAESMSRGQDIVADHSGIDASGVIEDTAESVSWGQDIVADHSGIDASGVIEEAAESVSRGQDIVADHSDIDASEVIEDAAESVSWGLDIVAVVATMATSLSNN